MYNSYFPIWESLWKFLVTDICLLGDKIMGMRILSQNLSNYMVLSLMYTYSFIMFKKFCETKLKTENKYVIILL